MRTSLAHHLLRYHPSEILDVCQHIRLRFPQDSGLASNALLTPDNNLPPAALFPGKSPPSSSLDTVEELKGERNYDRFQVPH